MLYIVVLLLYSRIIVSAAAVEKERSRRLTTAILNQVVREAVAFKAPPRTRGGKRGRVYYSTQVNFIWEDAWHLLFSTRAKTCTLDVGGCIIDKHVVEWLPASTKKIPFIVI